jgi:hypothetical protein
MNMADIETEKTVIVDRDTADRRSPSGLIVALVVLALLALFFLLGGFNMFRGGTGTGSGTDTMDTTSPQVQGPATDSPASGQ